MSSPAEAVPYGNQKYDDIRAQLAESGSLFEDQDFLPIDESDSIKWLRPSVSLTPVDALY